QKGLGSPEFMRVRAGVGRPQSSDPEVVSAWVLGRFSESEDEVAGLVARACDGGGRVVLGEGGGTEAGLWPRPRAGRAATCSGSSPARTRRPGSPATGGTPSCRPRCGPMP